MAESVIWMADNWLELFGALTGIIFVFLEIRQNLWLWPVGITTSAVYILVFFTGKLYADMLLQCYYLIISIMGWYWWVKGRTKSEKLSENEKPDHSSNEKQMHSGVTHIKPSLILPLSVILLILVLLIWYILSEFTDSPVPLWDSIITSLSIVATWMLARKILEHWYVWIFVNMLAALLFYSRELYPTTLLYLIYCLMSFIGLREWEKSIRVIN